MTTSNRPEISPTVDDGGDGWLNRWAREPFVHFLLLGGALFLAGSYWGGNAEEAPAEVFVSSGKIEHLAALFARTWQRPPTREELEGLVENHVREEVAYREGVALGLDRNDTIIRRRLKQKLEFVAEDLATQLKPTDAQLEEFLREHPESFAIAPRISFRQVFVDVDRRGEADASEAVEKLLVTLGTDPTGDATTQGDRTLLEHEYDAVTPAEVERLFGEDFASSLLDQSPGEWVGPARSAFGWHVMIVDQLEPGREPSLEEVRRLVTREWQHARRQELLEEYYRTLKQKYAIEIEWPAEEDGEGA